MLRGDSGTIGGYVSHNMPFMLGEMIEKEVLPGQIEVFNMATSGRTITKDSPMWYKKDWNYDHVKHSEPDILIMMFGSNDVFKGWKGKTVFKDSYEAFAKKMISLVGSDKTRFFMMTPPPLNGKALRDNGWEEYGQRYPVETKNLNEVYPKLFSTMVEDLKLPKNNFIDAFNLLGGHEFKN